jgi:MSHA biogenesis protein MshI
MAQRNMSDLFADGEKALAMLSFDQIGGLLTITHGGELYFARRIEVSWPQLGNENSGQRQYYFERIATELQRSFDHFDRQFNHLSLSQLLLAPTPQDLGLAGYLSSNLDVTVRAVDVTDVMQLPPTFTMNREEQWRLFHVLGAALRREGKAL